MIFHHQQQLVMSKKYDDGGTSLKKRESLIYLRQYMRLSAFVYVQFAIVKFLDRFEIADRVFVRSPSQHYAPLIVTALSGVQKLFIFNIF